MRLMRAEWRPGWYELDQSLELGATSKFAFFTPAPDAEPDAPLLFFNTLWSARDAVVAIGTVSRITHPTLGQIRKVDARGLDYTVVLIDGRELTVNAEEEPGRLYEKTDTGWSLASTQVDSWVLSVELTDLSALHPAIDAGRFLE
jgi:hypothetical protein